VGTCTDTEIIIPSYYKGKPVKVISGYAFKDCTFIEKVTFPSRLETIESRAFHGCSSIKSVHFPKSTESIYLGAFSNCPALESITVESGNKYYFSKDNCLISIYGGLYLGCKTSVIPDDGSVTGISNCAFQGCTGLKEIIIPSSVTQITDYAFSGCTALKSITLPDSVKKLGEKAFENCESLTDVVLSSNITEISDNLFTVNFIALRPSKSARLSSFVTLSTLLFASTLQYPK
jgi:hypothetical protein